MRLASKVSAIKVSHSKTLTKAWRNHLRDTDGDPDWFQAMWTDGHLDNLPLRT